MDYRPIPSVIGYSATADGEIISHHKLIPFALKQANHVQGYKQVNLKRIKVFVHALCMYWYLKHG